MLNIWREKSNERRRNRKEDTSKRRKQKNTHVKRNLRTTETSAKSEWWIKRTNADVRRLIVHISRITFDTLPHILQDIHSGKNLYENHNEEEEEEVEAKNPNPICTNSVYESCFSHIEICEHDWYRLRTDDVCNARALASVLSLPSFHSFFSLIENNGRFDKDSNSTG